MLMQSAISMTCKHSNISGQQLQMAAGKSRLDIYFLCWFFQMTFPLSAYDIFLYLWNQKWSEGTGKKKKLSWDNFWLTKVVTSTKMLDFIHHMRGQPPDFRYGEENSFNSHSLSGVQLQQSWSLVNLVEKEENGLGCLCNTDFIDIHFCINQAWSNKSNSLECIDVNCVFVCAQT